MGTSACTLLGHSLGHSKVQRTREGPAGNLSPGLQVPQLHCRAVLPRSVQDPGLHALLSLPDKVANCSRAAAEPGNSPWEEALGGSGCLSESPGAARIIKEKAVVGRLDPHSLCCGKAGEKAGEKVATAWVNMWQWCLPSQAPNAEACWSTARLNQAKCSHPIVCCVWSEWLLQLRVGILRLPPHSCGSPCAWGSWVWDAGMLLPARELHLPSGLKSLQCSCP